MEQWLLIAILQFANGAEGPTLPIETYPNYQSCMRVAESGENIVRRISGEWEAYMNESGDIRPLSGVFLTCVEDTSLDGA